MEGKSASSAVAEDCTGTEEARIIKKYLLAALIKHAFVSPIFLPSPVALAFRIHMFHAVGNLDQAFFWTRLIEISGTRIEETLTIPTDPVVVPISRELTYK